MSTALHDCCCTWQVLDRVKALGRGRVDLTIGSALDVFGGDIPYADVLAWQAREDAS